MKAYLYDVFHRCDSITDWTPTACTLSVDSTQKVEGKYSIKMASNAATAGLMRYDRTVDWSEFGHIIFSVYHPGYTNEVGRISLYTDMLNYKTWTFDFAAVWTERSIDLSSTPDASLGTLDLSNITFIIVRQSSETTPGEDYYFDFFKGKSIDVTDNITYFKITEEMGMPSWADLKIKGESLDHFHAGLEMEVYDSDDVLSWTGRILYPESVMEGTKVVGKLRPLGSNSQFNNVYRKNFTTARSSDYVLKNVIDNALPKFTHDDEIDDFSALESKYDAKTKIQKLFNYLMMLERGVIHHKPDGEMFYNKYDNLTASGTSWNQNTEKVKIVSYTPNANRHITRTPVIGANNDLGQVYYVGKASDAAVQKYGINQLQPWRDSEITNYAEAKQLGDNLLVVYSMDTQMISLLTVGKKHVQVGYTIEFAWTGVFSIAQHNFLVTKRVWYPMNDICELELTDNILTRKAFNVRVINKFYDEDAQQSYEESDVPESTEDGTVQPLVSISQLRVAGVGGAHTLASHTSKTHQELTDYNAEANVKHLTDAQLTALHAIIHVLATTGPHTGTLPWTDLNKTGSNLTDLATRLHAGLSDAPANAHHVAFVKGDADALYSVLAHIHDNRYYTETELNDGQLDNRYYTEAEVNGLLHTRLHAITEIHDHSANNHKIFHSDGAGHVIELALGLDGQVLTSTGAASAPAFEAPAAGGAALQLPTWITTRGTVMTRDTAWHDVDISGTYGAEKHLVFLYIYTTDDAAGGTVAFRPKDSESVYTFYTHQVANTAYQKTIVVQTNTSGVFQYKAYAGLLSATYGILAVLTP
ncbi:MAG: baseplate/adhesin [Thorarchaeia virus VerdaV2]|uniref:Baseplate/adhesin n=1 Tax=Thorarchaeia virus VerdaV2 TaxID=3070171 RepID=A0AA35CPJ9_9CAUD|nr:MAG: baseplate/adhesin [Thorarchaeia virus VerdaV2]BDI54908.1 MAG: baseplate/adhesin [Thorarchaeia virus VerdaV2]